MNERLDSLLKRYEELCQMAQDPELSRDINKYRDVMKEYSHLGEIAEANKEVESLLGQLESAESLVHN